MKQDIKKLKYIINQDSKTIFFGGAGVSTESGIPDFRGKDGLYNQKHNYDPEYLLSLTGFRAHPDAFWEFYREMLLLSNVKPNKGHLALAKLEKDGKLQAIVTQNIDHLHELAGSKNVYHLHGTIMTNHCLTCNQAYSFDEIQQMPTIPKCHCGGIIKPDVVFFEEMLPEDAWQKSLDAIRQANTLIVAGTSLSVYPAASLITEFSGENLIIINRDETGAEDMATIVIRDSFAEVLDQVVN